MKKPLISLLTAGLSDVYPMKKKRAHAKDASFCPRRSAFLIHIDESFTASVSPASSFYMSIGTAVHETLCRGYKKAGVLLYEELRMHELGLNIGGYIDAIIMIDEPRVVEFKTCGKLPEAPKPDHVAQASLYALASGLLNPRLLYLSRNVAAFGGELSIREFEIPTTFESMRKMAKSLAVGYYSSLIGYAPPIPEGLSKSKCLYCQFTDVCFAGAKSHLPALVEDIDIMEEVYRKADLHATEIMDRFEERRVETEAKIASFAKGEENTQQPVHT